MDIKILTLLFTLCSFLPIKAEDVIQVIPLYTQSGATQGSTHELLMNLNNTKPIWGIQFEIKLPEGITLPDNAFEIIDNRIPKVRIDTLHMDSLMIDSLLNDSAFMDSLKKDSIPFDSIVRDSIIIDSLCRDSLHQVEYNTVNGWIYVVISPNNDVALTDNSGNLLKVRFTVNENIKDGIHPIEIRNVLFVFEDGSTRPYDSSSYICLGTSPIKQGKYVDLSHLTNYIPTFVMDTINQDLAGNKQVCSLDLTGAKRLGKNPVLKNPNALCYVDASSQIAIDYDRAKMSNIVKKEGNDYRCNHLSLDEQNPFDCSHTVAVNNATLHSETMTTGWNTICLPFYLNSQQVEQTYGQGAYVENFYDVNKNYLIFLKAEEGYTGNTPALLHLEAPSSQGAYHFGAVTLLPTHNDSVITHKEVAFYGNYDGKRNVENLYLVNPDNTLTKGKSETVIMGFKAYLSIPETLASEDLIIGHDINTAIEDISAPISQEADIYGLNGILIQRRAPIKPWLENAPKGIYIINHKKIMVR